MRDRIMHHQKRNGFETIFDLLKEDLDELEWRMNDFLQDSEDKELDKIGEELAKMTDEEFESNINKVEELMKMAQNYSR